MIIGIVGYGVVGQAIGEGLRKKGHTIMINDVDAEKSLCTKEELVTECDVIFICVDTPTNKRGCDLSRVYEAFNNLHYHIAQKSREGAIDLPVIAIKSTVIPGTTDSLFKMYPRVCANPEFMRALTAEDDFLRPDRIIVGAYSEEVKEVMSELYNGWDTPLYITKPVVAELAKYLSNAFLVVKVAFSQEVKRICEMVHADPLNVMQLVCMDHRINDSHMNPVFGKIARDSACLPKDMMALIKQLEASGDTPYLLQSAYAMGVEDSRLVASLKIVEEEK
jgi:UDPglucose 6-dehydrogenase